MTLPITGPFTEVVNGERRVTTLGFIHYWSQRSRTWRRQRKPYNLPLAYTLQHRRILTHLSNPVFAYSQYSDLISGSDSISRDVAYNKAYDRFRAKVVNDNAQLGESLGERKKAVSMISDRALQLARFAKEMKRFRFQAAAEILGMQYERADGTKPKPRKGTKLRWRKTPYKGALPILKESNLRRNAKAFGSNFLEAHLGWEPLIGDIHSAGKILQGGVPPVRVTTSASFERKWQTYSSGANQTVNYRCKTSVRISASMFVSNPNLHLMDQLGLVNPASIAWELMPFSMLFDWVGNMGTFLRSFTDFWGVTLIDPFWTELGVNAQSSSRTAGVEFTRYTGVSTYMNRTVGSIPGPTLRIRQPYVVSPVRGLTAISLLLQRLK